MSIDERRAQFQGGDHHLQLEHAVADVAKTVDGAGWYEDTRSGSDNLANIVDPRFGGARDDGEDLLELMRVARRAYPWLTLLIQEPETADAAAWIDNPLEPRARSTLPPRLIATSDDTHRRQHSRRGSRDGPVAGPRHNAMSVDALEP